MRNMPTRIGGRGPNRSIKYPVIGASTVFSALASAMAMEATVLLMPSACETGLKKTVAP